MQIKKIITGMLVAVLVLLLVPQVKAQEFMSVAELRPGMQGVARTVITGDTIEEFDVEILGIMPQQGPTGGSLILIKTSGPLIERTGGIAQGMSGSPVYIDGKLVGAIAYGWGMTDSTVGMLTPIGEMLKLFDTMAQADAKALELEKIKLQEKKTEQNKEEQTSSVAQEEEKSITKELAAAVQDFFPETTEKAALINKMQPKSTALMASGFTQRGLSFLQERLKAYNLTAQEVGNVAGSVSDKPLEPGSAVSADLVKGDLNLGALGTVTYVDQGRVLAFGHPFLKLGDVDYFMSRAWMLTSVKSIASPFKLGVVGEPIGRIKQDRGAGIAGVLGRSPKIIPVLVKVHDRDKGTEREFALQILSSELLSKVLIESSVYNLVDRVLDRNGEGSALVSFNIVADNLPAERKISRKNMFYSQNNITGATTGELYAGMNLLADNRFEKINIVHVDVDVDVTSECKLAKIISAKPGQEKVKAGEKFEIAVKIQPYRGKAQTKIIEYTIPEKFPKGKASLMVRGGASIAWIQAMIKQQQRDSSFLQEEMTRNKSLVQIVDEFNNQDNNQDIVVDILPNFPKEKNNGKQLKKALSNTQNENNPLEMLNPLAGVNNNKTFSSILFGSPFKKAVPTEYLVNGDTMVMVEVE